MAELYLSDGSEFSKIPLITETVTTDTNLDNHNKTGYYVVKGVPSTGGNDFSPVSQWVSVFTDSDIGTPFQIAIPDGSNPYLYKRSLANNSWNKLYAGYADSAGSANTANSATTANSANVANTATKSSSTDGLDIADTRNDNPAPKDAGFDKKKLTADFKLSNKIGSPTGFGSEIFCGVLSLAPWADSSGGDGYQLAFGYANTGHPRLAIRSANLSAASWNSWYKIYTSGVVSRTDELPLFHGGA